MVFSVAGLEKGSMRIVHVEDNFIPEAGYQLNILTKYMAALGMEVYIVTSDGRFLSSALSGFFDVDNIKEKDIEFTAQTGVKIIRIVAKRAISNRVIFDRSLYETVEGLSPDVLYVHGNDTWVGIRYAMKLGRTKYPIIFDNHMLDMASVNKFAKLFYMLYRIFITPKLKKNKTLILRVVDDPFIFKRLGVPKELSRLVSFGSDVMAFHPNPEMKILVREELNIPLDSLVFVYAGKLDESKGGLFFAKSIKARLESIRQLIFLIIGTPAGEFADTVAEIFGNSENRLIILPTQPYKQLARYFQCADIAIFPKQCSLTYYDVQACALPVILEDNTINTSRVNHNNGVIFKSGDMEDFREKIRYMANLADSELEEMSVSSMEDIVNNYNYKNVADKYIEVIEGVYTDFYNKGQSI